MDYFEIGQRIRKFRKANNLSQEQLAEIVNISTTHMSHIETGNTKLSLPVFVDIAKALGVKTDELLYDTPQLDKSEAKAEIMNLIETSSKRDAYILASALKAFKTTLEKYPKEEDI